MYGRESWNFGNPEFWNPEYGLKNPESHQLLEFGIRYLESGIKKKERIRNPCRDRNQAELKTVLDSIT